MSMGALYSGLGRGLSQAGENLYKFTLWDAGERRKENLERLKMEHETSAQRRKEQFELGKIGIEAELDQAKESRGYLQEQYMETLKQQGEAPTAIDPNKVFSDGQGGYVYGQRGPDGAISYTALPEGYAPAEDAASATDMSKVQAIEASIREDLKENYGWKEGDPLPEWALSRINEARTSAKLSPLVPMDGGVEERWFRPDRPRTVYGPGQGEARLKQTSGAKGQSPAADALRSVSLEQTETGTVVNGKWTIPGNVDFQAAVTAGFQTESGNTNFKDGKPVQSGKGAMYASQTVPKTAGDPGFKIRPADTSGSKEQVAAEYNRVGTEYMAAMLDKYKSLPAAYAAYNMGPQAYDEWFAAGADPKKLPTETRNHVQRAMDNYVAIARGQQGGGAAPAGAQAGLRDKVLARAEQARAARSGSQPAPDVRMAPSHGAPAQGPAQGAPAVPAPTAGQRTAPPGGTPYSPFGGLSAMAEAGQTESLGTGVGRAARAVPEMAYAFQRGAETLSDPKAWRAAIASMEEWRQRSLAQAQARAGINDQILQEMYAQQAQRGKSFERFISDFLAEFNKG